MSSENKLTQDFDHSKYVELIKESRFKPGDLCWARKEKVRAWPAKVLDPSDEELKSYPRSEEIYVFVNFFEIDEKKFVPESQVWDYLQGCKKFTRMKVNKTFEKAVKTIMKVAGNMSESSGTEGALNDESCNNKSAVEDSTEEHKVSNNDSEAIEKNETPTTIDLHSKSVQQSDGELINKEENSLEKESQVKSMDCNAKFDDNLLSKSQQNGTDDLPLPHTSGNSLPPVNLAVNESVESNIPEQEETSSNDRSECLKNVENISEFEPAGNASSEVDNTPTTASSETKIQSEPKGFLKQPTSEILNEQREAAVLQNETTPENISETGSRHVRTPAEILALMLSELENTEKKRKAEKVRKCITRKQLKRKIEKGKHEKIRKQAKVDVYEFHDENLEISEALSPHRSKKTERDTVQTSELTAPSGSKLYQHKSPKAASTSHRVSRSSQKVNKSSLKSTGSPKKQTVVNIVGTASTSSQVLTEPISKDKEENSSDDMYDIPEVMLKCMPNIVVEQFSGDGVLKHGKFVAPKTLFGFIGLGNLGRKLVSKLLFTDHSLMIWNRNRVKCYEFLKKGATMANRPADVFSHCEVVFCCLSDANAVKEVLFDESGVLEVLKCGKGFVNLTTMDPETALDVKDLIDHTGASYLEAPISTFKKKTNKEEEPENAYMSVTAGDSVVLNKCLTCLASFSARIYYVGPIPKATNMVLALNALVGSITASFAQGFALAKQAGLPFDDLYKLLTITGLLTPTLYSAIKDICQNKEGNHMPPKVYSKSLSAVLDIADDFPIPVLAAAKEAFVGNHLRKYT